MRGPERLQGEAEAVDADGAARDDRRAMAARIDPEAGENALEAFGHGGAQEAANGASTASISALRSARSSGVFASAMSRR